MIYTRPGFDRRYKKLSPGQQERADAAVERFAASLGNPHEHSGVSIRPFGRYLEFRAGQDLRILAVPESGDFFLVCVGDHDEIRSFVKNNP